MQVMGRGAEALEGSDKGVPGSDLFTHLFSQHIYTEYLVRAKHCSRSWGYTGEQSSCPRGAQMPMSEKALWQQ